jgi:hypothetical protein
VIVNVGADANVKLVGGDAAETVNEKNKMGLIEADSFCTLRVLSGKRAMLESVGPPGCDVDINADAAALTPPALCAARLIDAEVPVAMPAGGFRIGRVTPPDAGTAATDVALANEPRL